MVENLGIADLVERIPAEQKVIRRAKACKRRLSLRAIADKLTDEDFETKLGGRWHAKTIRNILGEHARSA